MEQNVTKAAARLHLSQPAVSAQLSRLRDEFDDPLLIPAQRGMTPTAKAIELLDPLRQALDQVRATVATHRNFNPAKAKLTVAIACTDYLQAAVVKRLVVACDAGPISNPDGIRNQLEGAALHGVSRTLAEEVTWDDQKVTAVDWQTYRTLSVGTQMPVVETVLMDRPDVPATGAGETSITGVAAAIGNAIFDATGVRLRQVPFIPERVKAALAARRT